MNSPIDLQPIPQILNEGKRSIKSAKEKIYHKMKFLEVIENKFHLEM